MFFSVVVFLGTEVGGDASIKMDAYKEDLIPFFLPVFK